LSRLSPSSHCAVIPRFLSILFLQPVFFSSPCFTRSFPLTLLLFSFFRVAPQLARALARDRPSFSLTHGIPPSRLFIAILPSSTIQSRGTSPFPFFLLSSFLPAIIRFHWPSVPRRGNSGGSLTFASGDKYGFVRGIPGSQRRQVFDTDPPSCAILRDRDLFGADPSLRAMSHKRTDFKWLLATALSLSRLSWIFHRGFHRVCACRTCLSTTPKFISASLFRRC